jgi:tRNA pseudouridine13 synthase
MSSFSVPKIDRWAGIGCYCTLFSGTRGSIKQGSEGFKVFELVDQSLASAISKYYDEQHRYPLYILEKKDIDSNHALIEVKNQFHIRLRIMGIKDAMATTTQYAGMENPMRNPLRELKSKHARLTLIGFTKRPIGKRSLVGNKFEIVIHNARSADLSDFILQMKEIGNFYGLQRFGSERLVTHLVGKAIVKKKFDKAIELLLSYTTDYDTPLSKELRNMCTDPKNFRQALKILPRGMDIERRILSALVAGKNSINVLRTIPITIRRLFVQAYQAFIFNKCLSISILNGENLLLPYSNDLCFEMEGQMSFGRIIKFDPSVKKIMVPAIRMVGYTFQPGKGRFEVITKEIMQEEDVEPKDFYITEMQELSQQGGFRQAALLCSEFSYKPNPLTVSFILPKGSYATTLLREIVKPQDPIKSGF